jgi:hypothetical protein
MDGLRLSNENDMFNQLGMVFSSRDLDTEDGDGNFIVSARFDFLPYNISSVIAPLDQTRGSLLQGTYERTREPEHLLAIASVYNLADDSVLTKLYVKVEETNDAGNTLVDITSDGTKCNISGWISAKADGSTVLRYKKIRYRGLLNSLQVTLGITAAAQGDMSGVLGEGYVSFINLTS